MTPSAARSPKATPSAAPGIGPTPFAPEGKSSNRFVSYVSEYSRPRRPQR